MGLSLLSGTEMEFRIFDAKTGVTDMKLSDFMNLIDLNRKEIEMLEIAQKMRFKIIESNDTKILQANMMN